MENNENVKNLLLKLLSFLIPNIQDKKMSEKYLSYFMRLLNSRLNEITRNEANIQLMLSDFVSKSSRIEDNNRFIELYTLLKTKKNIKRRWALLYLFYRLLPEENNNQINTLERSKVLQSIFQKQDLVEEKNYKANGEIDSNIEKSINNYQKTYSKKKLAIIVNKPNSIYSKTIYEKDIINDLIYVFQAIDGHYITYSSSNLNSGYFLNHKIPFNDNIFDQVSHLCELGFLYKKVRDQLNIFSESNIQSQIVQSFCFSIRNELNEYYKLISIFKKMTKNEEIISINQENGNNNNNDNENDLTIKKLLLWTLEPMERMKWLAVSCDAISSLRGISIISQIHSYVYYCGAEKYLSNLLKDVSKPMFKIVKNWLILGELHDPFKEFFVEIKENVNDDDIWRLRYNIIIKNIPSFFENNIVQKIFEIGKCVNFIRNFCGEKDFSLIKIKSKIFKNEVDDMKIIRLNENEMLIDNEKQNKKIEESPNIKSLQSIQDLKNTQEKDKKYKYLRSLEYIFNLEKEDMDFGVINDLYSEIDIVHLEINKELLSILFKKFIFQNHLESIYRYLLLGQGDMMQYLMNLIVYELDKPSSQVFKHNLSSILETAIRASNAQFHNNECIKRLNIKLLESNLGDTGWDIFNLEYIIDKPLTVIFTKNLMLRYQELFKFFWKLKKIEYNQSQIWKNFFYHSHSLRKGFDIIRKPLHKTMLLNQQIIHFCTTLHNYIALEVLETEWNNIIEKIDKVEYLDNLISLHEAFVKNILERSLINYPDIHKKLEKIFELIMRFNSVQNILFTTVLEDAYRNYNKQYQDSDSKFKFKDDSLKSNVLAQVNKFSEDYVEEMIDLISKIDLVGKGNLKYLSMKLNYNNYYTEVNERKINRNYFSKGGEGNIEEFKKIDDNKQFDEGLQILKENDDLRDIYKNSENSGLHEEEDHNNVIGEHKEWKVEDDANQEEYEKEDDYQHEENDINNQNHDNYDS